MKPTDWYDKFMVLVGVFISCNVLPHIYQMVKVESAQGQSIWGPISLIVGLIFWLIYGYRHRLPTVLITNTVGILFNVAYLATIVYYT
jgi:uncharacterized protein with PQ loop repeat